MSSPEQLRAAFSPFETDRLLLLAVDEGDVDSAFAIHGNPETHRFHPAGVTSSREQSLARIAEWELEWQQYGFGFWAIRLRGAPEVIGFGGLSLRSLRDQPVLNTYYRFDPAAWGHGYATEMASAAVALARQLLPGVPVVVRTRPGNRGARAVAEKIGLVRAPLLDDELLTYVSSWSAATA